MTIQTLVPNTKKRSTVNRQPVIIDSVEPLEGQEGTIVTIKGSGFPTYDPERNNCVVMASMGACARALPESTETELKVRIGPVPLPKDGIIRMWPGNGGRISAERVCDGNTTLSFTEAAVFRNAAPETSTQINFRLIKASANAYAGSFQAYGVSPGVSNINLGGYENSPVIKVSFPETLSVPSGATVDACIVLKEPTFAIDIAGEIEYGEKNMEECLRAVAKGIVTNANFVGEQVYADVARNQTTGELELYVTKPYLSEAMLNIHFNYESAR
ncbi:MAG: hypothetical protein QNJ33_00465 [Crocosphaera sp.]|nr:hypothetical protein [Crocosphaera sp.]